MKLLLIGVNSRYIHSNPALPALSRAVAGLPCPPATESVEFTINQQPTAITAEIFRRGAQILAFSVYIWNAELLRGIISDLRQLLPDSIILLGGAEAAARPAHYLELFDADAVCCGEGEEALPALLEAYGQRQIEDMPRQNFAALPAMRGWLLRGQSEPFQPAPPVDLRRLPFPYDAAAKEQLRAGGHVVYYESSRGCPFSCSFCASARQALRERPLELVLDELEQLAEIGGQIKFVDRTFNANPARALAITKRVLELHRPRLSWHFEISPYALPPELVELWLAAPRNYIKLEIGVQTLHGPALAAIGRHGDWRLAEPQVKRLIAAGNNHLHLDLIAGLPQDTPQTFAASFHHLHQLNADYLQFGFLKLLPGSPLAEQAPRLGLIASRQPPYRVLQTPQMPAEFLFSLLKAEKIFNTLYNKGRYEFRPTLLKAAERYAGGALAMYQQAAALAAPGMDNDAKQALVNAIAGR